MTKDQSIPATTELSDDDLDAVQGAGNRVQQASSKGVVLSSESETTYLSTKGDSKGVILSSETHEPNFKRDSKGIVLSSETENPYGK
ncbi:hypothetical protein A8B78_16420 [Jannaschia sp. EhC01]|nr:hypothetical protein A8B78_16420 [Jannaschia sp. EhC01]